MKLTRKQAVEKYGEEVVNRLEDESCEPTGRCIYPDDEHAGMDEYMSFVTIDDNPLQAYYYVPSDYDGELDDFYRIIDHFED